MEFNFSPPRLLLLALLLGAFAALGGFTLPQISEDREVFHSPARVQKAWSYCVLMFVAGAISASLVDHTIGNLDPTNLRTAYILLGAGLMIAGYFWLRTLRQTVERPAQVVSVATSLPP